MRAARDLLGRANRQVRADLRTDPYLPYILALALVLAGFWVWHSLPNFATRDERWRVLEPVEPVGFVLDDPRPGSIREGIAFWREYGATFYLYGAVLAPVVAYVVLTGGGETVSAVAHHRQSALWAHWNRGPAWLWTTMVLLARLVNVVLAVGCVYVTYRLGTLLRDRATGRLAALLLALTWGLVVLAHEAGEDVPALFFFLVTMYLALRYVQNGERRLFYAACACGGVAIALKLTAGLVVVFVVGAHLLRERRAGELWGSAFRPRFLLRGATLGAVIVAVGYPVILVGAVDDFGARLLGGVTEKSSATHGWLVRPTWWWLLRGYLHGLGAPLFVGAVAGVAAGLTRLRERSIETDGVLLALAGVGSYLAVYSLWGYVRTHHLLPTFPLLVLLVAVALGRLSERRPAVARVLVALLVASTGLYTVAGDLAYASQPRDEARAWLSDRVDDGEAVETYVRDPQDAAVPHGVAVHRITDREMTINGTTREPPPGAWILAMPHRCPAYVELNYQRGLLYLATENHSNRAGQLSHPALREFVGQLLSGDRYPYEVAARFGREPAFLRDDEGDGPLGAVRPVGRDPMATLLSAGVYPRTAQYGDPQDFGVNQYTVVLRRTGPCDPDG